MVGFVCGSEVFLRLHNSHHLVTVLHGPCNLVTHLLSEDIEGYFLLIFFETHPQEYPNAWIFTLKILTRCVEWWRCSWIFPIPVVSLIVAFFIVVVFIFSFLLFRSFLSNPYVGVWAWSLLMVSEYFFLLHKHIIANINKVCLLDLSCPYSVHWWH